MDKANPFTGFLESEKEDCLSKANGLAKDNRQDEADMQKIRANVFGIFATLSRTAEERFPDSQAQFLREQIEKISRAWEESLSAAESRGDPINAMKERVKLDAIAEIGAYYAHTVEGTSHGK